MGTGKTWVPQKELLFMAATSSAIADLKAQWPNLHDLDRAKAILDLKQCGGSNRELARQLPVVESGLRRLLKALEAPAKDQLLAYEGKITINELIRRAAAAKAGDAVKQGEARKLRRAKASIKASKTICDWLRSEDLGATDRQQVAGEARRLLIEAQQNNHFPRGITPPGLTVAEIIKGSQPRQPKPMDLGDIHWRAVWLAEWVYRAFPDEWVRYKAIEIALEKQFNRNA